MKKFGEQLKKQARHIRLSASQRDDLRTRVVSYMEYHPLNAHTTLSKDTATSSSFILSKAFALLAARTTYVRGFASLFVLLVLVIPFVAEKAVPGDALYLVKVRFNEEVRSTLSLSPYAKVEWETQRLERRIAEARLLAEEGKLTDEIEAEVARAVQEHTTAAQQEIALMRKSDSDEADIAEIVFASAIAVQSEVLKNRVSLENPEGNAEGYSVLAIADAVAVVRTDAEAAQGGTTPSFEKLLARIELESTRAQELFTSVRTDASEEEVAHVQRRLSDIQQKVSKAITLHTSANTEDEEVAQKLAATSTTATSSVATTTTEVEVEEIDEEYAAIQLLRESLTDTKKLISFMTDIDVRANVNIETLVPVTLTDQEKADAQEQASTTSATSTPEEVLGAASTTEEVKE